MNEGTKTGAFWVSALVMLAVGLFVAWPASTDGDKMVEIGKPIFEEFKDPLAASSMKIATFDEEQGQLDTFEVRRDADSGQWTIPSRGGYPADALEQMKDAANALVGLTILDIQTSNAEDHDDLGVVEPKLEDLEVGDVGVGRMVTFRDDSQKTLASLILGNSVEDEEGKIYVRRPGQDPVYVVKLDDAVLSTRFEDWIEKDLLQLSSIDVKRLGVEDYTAAISGRGAVDLSRNFNADLELDGADWKVTQFVQFDPSNALADPEPIDIGDDQVVNREKLNEMRDALDDLKIVDVVRKPEGMSANLRANKELISDNEAVASLASRGFFPVQTGADGDIDVVSANGELTVTLNDGVQYSLRFGNVSGLTDAEDVDDGETAATSVNRYMLVTARVNDADFPPPALKPVPQSIEELDASIGGGATDTEETVDAESVTDEPIEPESDPADPETPAANEPVEMSLSDETGPSDATDKPDTGDTVDEAGDVEVKGEGQANVDGQGDVDDEATTDAEANADEPATEETVELTEDEKQERLEAEQEKVLKENQRMLDERKDRLAAARRRVADLNARFADWYYVIPEATYGQLRVNREELLLSEAEAAQAAPPSGGPNFGGPNFGGPNFGN